MKKRLRLFQLLDVLNGRTSLPFLRFIVPRGTKRKVASPVVPITKGKKIVPEEEDIEDIPLVKLRQKTVLKKPADGVRRITEQSYNGSC